MSAQHSPSVLDIQTKRDHPTQVVGHTRVTPCLSALNHLTSRLRDAHLCTISTDGLAPI